MMFPVDWFHTLEIIKSHCNVFRYELKSQIENYYVMIIILNLGKFVSIERNINKKFDRMQLKRTGLESIILTNLSYYFLPELFILFTRFLRLAFQLYLLCFQLHTWVFSIAIQFVYLDTNQLRTTHR